MKKYLLIILLCILPGLGFAGNSEPVSDNYSKHQRVVKPLYASLGNDLILADAGIIEEISVDAPAAGDAACGDGTADLICQNLEGAGYDNSESWTESGASTIVNEDYTATILRGSQSILVDYDGSTAYAYIDFTDTDPVYGFFRFWGVDADTPSSVIMKLKGTNGAADNFEIDADGDGAGNYTFSITHGSVTSASTGNFSAETTLYIWWDYEAGTGANGKAHLFVDTDNTKPAATLTIENGDDTVDADRFYLVGPATFINVFDQIYADESAVGDVSN